MKQTLRWWTGARSVIVWWFAVTLTLWLLGTHAAQPVRFTGRAASAVLLVAIGEAGDWLPRHWVARRHGKGIVVPDEDEQ
jgi:hypothetical protein